MKAVNKFLNTNNIIIKSGDYADALSEADEQTFVYLDPPYHPISENSNFTGYIQGGWNIFDQIRLREACDELNAKGVKFLLSNSSALIIKDQYEKYNISIVKANRAINSDSSNRGEVDELLIRNYE